MSETSASNASDTCPSCGRKDLRKHPCGAKTCRWLICSHHKPPVVIDPKHGTYIGHRGAPPSAA